ncbi:putative porin [Chitinophaga horti]|uniref:Porin n=1 Tax=Chitinophaga horti TaxID=2920382 RepID=A0ABY6IWH9_9BACT|nr:putative porin [Chitinophaga horti]UYQ91645.1 putative porin [Chitinophaga horti]
MIFCSHTLLAQFNSGRFSGMGSGGGTMQRDTSRHEHEPDTLTIRYRYLGEPTDFMLDSSLNDWYRSFLRVPNSYVTLGNSGSAARNLIFTPRMTAGFDAGFHAYDIYRFTHDDARFFYTNRPYTELGYLIGNMQEQLINAQHTQNRTERFNFNFEFRKVSAPGFFKNQNTDHNGVRLTARFNSKNKRYHAFASFYNNKLTGGENGGIPSDTFLTNPDFKRRRTIPVNLGGQGGSFSFFNNSISTKNTYKEASIRFLHHYDWGKGDTVHVNDTTDYYKYDPFFRVQHTLTYTSSRYEFIDQQVDSNFYKNNYGFDIADTDTLFASHFWRTISNDLSLIQFPVRGNLGHFISAGARFDHTIGEFLDTSRNISFQNFSIHGEYRNKTKNQKWDLSAKGELYLFGENAGDYVVSGTLSRYINPMLGNVSLSFRNVNREPSYVYRYFGTNRVAWESTVDYGKENITQFQFAARNERLQYDLTANYFVFNKFNYFSNFAEAQQFNSLFNLLQVVFSKRFSANHLHWYADLAFQQLHGNSPIQLPTVWTRHRFTYEDVLYKNLNLVTGLEASYNTDYNADNYSPLLGQFFYQNTERISNYPDVHAFVHFRIKSFNAFVRGENLNTFLWKNNMSAPLYPRNNFAFRLGIRWWFVN